MYAPRVAVHDRVYMRDDPTPPWRGGGGIRSWPLVGWILLAHCVGVLVHAASRGWFHTPLEPWTVLSWDALRAGRVWTIATHLFVGGIPSISWLFFIAAYWYFGRHVETALGAARFRSFVALAVLAGAALFAAAFAAGAGSALGGDDAYGLDGLATAFVVHAAFRDPRMPISIWFIQIPLWVFGVVWVAFDVAAVAGLAGGAGSNLWIDLGGALFGFAAWKWDVVPDVRAWLDARARDRERAAADRARREREGREARVDALLDKISARGIGSLTDEERAFLDEASRKR